MSDSTTGGKTVIHSGIELEPVESLDLGRIDSFSDLLSAMKATSFAGRQLGEAADILHDMTADDDCFVVGTFSGAMTVAKQGLVLCDMIEKGMLQAIVSTGALMCHGFVEAAGMAHYKHRPDLDDEQLYRAGFDRVYDTLELEQNLDDTEMIVREVLSQWPEGQVACSRTLSRELGRWLAENTSGRGILKSAFEHDVPIYVPAFSDSELGLDFAISNRLRKKAGKPAINFDPFLDLEHYTERIAAQRRTGIFTIGGGVPRNWAQQVGPFIDIINKRGAGEGEELELHRFRFAVRICPEPVHWGGLSGCTYSEGVSWGKFVPVSEGGRFAEVAADATVVWPLLVAGVLERLGHRGSQSQ